MHAFRSKLCLLTVALSACCVTPAQQKPTASPYPLATWNSNSKICFERDGHKFEITIHGQSVTVKRDGKPIASKNIKRKGNRVDVCVGDDRIATVELNTAMFWPGYQPPTFNPGIWSPITTKRARLGIRVGAVSDALASQLGVDSKKCVIVLGVTKGQEAAKSGIEKHDIITHIDGKPSVTQAKLQAALMNKKPGNKMKFRVLRCGKPETITVKLGESNAINYSWPSATKWSKSLLQGNNGFNYYFGPNSTGTFMPHNSTGGILPQFYNSDLTQRNLGWNVANPVLLDSFYGIRTDPKKAEAEKAIDKLEKQIEAIRKQHAEVKKLLEKLAK